MFPTPAFAGDEFRMRMLAPMSDAAQENAPTAEYFADTQTRWPCSLASLAAPLDATPETQAAGNDRAPTETQAAGNDRAPTETQAAGNDRAPTELQRTPDAPASPRTPPNPYKIAMAPLRALANLFTSFLHANKEVATPLATAYQVQLRDSPKQDAAHYKCSVPAAACGGRVGSVDAFASPQTPSAHSATPLGTAYRVQLHEPPKPDEARRYECSVPTACGGRVGSITVDAPLQTSTGSEAAEHTNDGVQQCTCEHNESGKCVCREQQCMWRARTSPDEEPSAKREDPPTSTSANPYLVVFSEPLPTVTPTPGSDNFLV